MHKNIVAADIEIDEAICMITQVNSVYAKEHMPLGVVRNEYGRETIDRYALNQWWANRCIPSKRRRSGFPASSNPPKDAAYILRSSPQQLVTESWGLSLSDHYWLSPCDNELSNTALYENVNFFDNVFSEDVGDILLGLKEETDNINYWSPDNTTNGNLKKRWRIIDGKRCLFKSGSYPFQQQSFNEVIASRVMDRLEIDHVPYTVTWINNEPYSVCEDFVKKDTELITAWQIMQLRTKANHENEYLHFVNICRELGIDIVPALDRMIVLDYIIANEDRHYNNFGLLRNANTLEWLGAAPIFDSGTSLWYNKLTARIPASGIICKPFKKTHGEQLKLASSLEWFEASKLDGIEDEILEVFSDDKAAQYIDTERAKTIAAEVRNRIETVASMAMSHTNKYDISSTEGDVEEDVAESYGMKME